MANAVAGATRLSWGILLVRLMVGWVFLAEGVQKFLYPDTLGVGRFSRIGIPVPQYSAPFVGVTEIVCGLLLMVGLFTVPATIPLLIDITVAIGTTKVPMLVKQGFWPAMHEARVDYCMLLGLLAIALFGAGQLSIDKTRARGR